MVMEESGTMASTGVSVSVSVKKGDENYHLAASGKNPKAVINSLKTMVQELQKAESATASTVKVTNG